MRLGGVRPTIFLLRRPVTRSNSVSRCGAPRWRFGTRRLIYQNHHHHQHVDDGNDDEDNNCNTTHPQQDSYHARLVAQGHRPPLLLDVSPREIFARNQRQLRQLPNVLAVSMPLTELPSRLYELPPPHEAVLEVGGEGKVEVGIAKHLLESAGWRCQVAFHDHGAELDLYVTAAAAAAVAVTAGQQQQQQQREKRVPVMVGGGSSSSNSNSGDGGEGVAHVRPNPFLHMTALELIDWKALFSSSSPSSSPLMIDLGCGSGRDAFFLARQAQQYHQHQQARVLAVDNHGDALERTAALAARGGVNNIIKCVKMDLRRPRASAELLKQHTQQQQQQQQQQKACLVHAARFLERRLLSEWLARPDAVVPGGYVLWSTFRDAEEEKGERNSAPPFATSRRLRKGELGGYFRGEGGREGGLYEVLHEEEGGQLATRGVAVPASFVVARRRK